MEIWRKVSTALKDLTFILFIILNTGWHLVTSEVKLCKSEIIVQN